MDIKTAKPMSTKKDTVPFLTRPKRDLVKHLSDLAEKYKRESGNQLMVEIAEMYTDLWVEAEKARLAMFEEQWTRLQRALTLPITSARAEQSAKQNAQGKKRRK